MREFFKQAVRPSLVRSATISFIIVAALTMFAEVTLVILKYGLSRDVLMTTGAEHEAEVLAEYLQLGPDGTLSLVLPQDVAHPFQRYPHDYGYQAIQQDGVIIASANAELFAGTRFNPAWNLDSSVRQIQRKSLTTALVMKRAEFGGAPIYFRITLGRDPADLRWWLMHDEMLDHVIVPMVPLTLAMLIANIFALRRSLRPLAEAAQNAEAINAKTTGLRLETDNLPMEIVPLVVSINRALTRLDQVVGFQRDFTATVAHELRTPLAVLTLQLGQHTSAGNDSGLIVAGEMTHLVNQLLNVAQLEASTTDAFESFDLADMARQTVSRLAPLAVERGREIEFDDYGSPPILGNRDAIAAAVRNLIENALRATPSGSAVVVACGPGARLSVRDHGPGVPEALKTKLFAAFTQGLQNAGGAGLGLAIVAKTMELQGGRAWYENLADGCVFRLDFATPATPTAAADCNILS